MALTQNSEFSSIMEHGLNEFVTQANVSKISVTPEKVKSLTDDMRTAANTLQTNAEDLDGTMTTLFSDWEGTTKDAVEAAYLKLKEQLFEIDDEVRKVANNLIISCNKKVAIDRAASGAINI